jgi:hypothetical protein
MSELATTGAVGRATAVAAGPPDAEAGSGRWAGVLMRVRSSRSGPVEFQNHPGQEALNA